MYNVSMFSYTVMAPFIPKHGMFINVYKLCMKGTIIMEGKT